MLSLASQSLLLLSLHHLLRRGAEALGASAAPECGALCAAMAIGRY